MIRLHALDAPHAIPGLRIARGEPMFHLLSDISGPAGTAELLLFIRAMGAHDAWLQAAGTYREHFDIFGDWTAAARILGAQPATNREVGEMLRVKRASMEQLPEAVPALTRRQMESVRSLLLASDAHALTAMVASAGEQAASLALRLLVNTSRPHIAVIAGSGLTGQVGKLAAAALQARGIDANLIAIDATPSDPHFLDHLRDHDLIIDAIFGDGLRGAPSETTARWITAIGSGASTHATRTPVLAIDLPSGLDPDEAGVRDVCVRATATLALGVPRRALSLWSNAPYCGAIYLAPLALAPRLIKQVGAHPGPTFGQTHLRRLIRGKLADDVLESPICVLRFDPASIPSTSSQGS